MDFIYQMIQNFKDCYKHIPYTWKHYLAFLKVEKELLGYYKYKFHDWDKLGMYIFFPWLGVKKIGEIHRNNALHHPGNKSGSCRWEEAIIDWECARFTKPDKPYTAKETMEKWYSEYSEVLIPYLRKLKLY